MRPSSQSAPAPFAPETVVLARREGRARSGQPEMLFVSPVLPDDSGNGLAMRGALFLRAVCPHWNVRLLVIDLFGAGPVARDWPKATLGCAQVVVVQPSPDPLFGFIGSLRDPAYRGSALLGYPLPQLARFSKPSAVAAALACLGRRESDRVHVFRLYFAPFAEPLLGQARASLDLDDDDARTAGSMAALLAAMGRADEASSQQAEGRKWAAFAAAWAPRFELVSLAAPSDADRLARFLPAIRVACVPNAVGLPEPLDPPPAGSPFTLLFVGTMGYLPNRDAAVLLATEVLPAVRRRCGAPIRLILAGGGADAELLALARPGEV
jgi:polysaccharide biosynthesis protein PslH